MKIQKRLEYIYMLIYCQFKYLRRTEHRHENDKVFLMKFYPHNDDASLYVCVCVCARRTKRLKYFAFYLKHRNLILYVDEERISCHIM